MAEALSRETRPIASETPGEIRKRALWRSIRQEAAGYLFIGPALVFIGVVFAYPLVRVVIMSFYRISVGKSTFVGLGNYRAAVTDRIVREAFGNNALLLLCVPVLVLLSLLLAALLFERMRGARIYRTLVFFPYILSTVVVGIVFSYLLRFDGPMNTLLKALGLRALVVDWLGTSQAIYGVMGVIVWQQLGFGVMLFLAAMTGLDPEVQEAARVDGASWLQTLFRITIPQLTAIIGFYVVFLIIQMFSWVFNYVYVMTNGGPNFKTTVMELVIYHYATDKSLPGMASALSVLLFLAVLVFVVIQMRFRLHGRGR